MTADIWTHKIPCGDCGAFLQHFTRGEVDIWRCPWATNTGWAHNVLAGDEELEIVECGRPKRQDPFATYVTADGHR